MAGSSTRCFGQPKSCPKSGAGTWGSPIPARNGAIVPGVTHYCPVMQNLKTYVYFIAWQCCFKIVFFRCFRRCFFHCMSYCRFFCCFLFPFRRCRFLFVSDVVFVTLDVDIEMDEKRRSRTVKIDEKTTIVHFFKRQSAQSALRK